MVSDKDRVGKIWIEIKPPDYKHSNDNQTIVKPPDDYDGTNQYNPTNSRYEWTLNDKLKNQVRIKFYTM